MKRFARWILRMELVDLAIERARLKAQADAMRCEIVAIKRDTSNLIANAAKLQAILERMVTMDARDNVCLYCGSELNDKNEAIKCPSCGGECCSACVNDDSMVCQECDLGY